LERALVSASTFASTDCEDLTQLLMYLANELPYLSPPHGVGAFTDAILSARNKRPWLAQLGISDADTLRKLTEDHETLDTS
jgi:hypothetical protein